jgi:L-fuculose-phosphate aldolase
MAAVGCSAVAGGLVIATGGNLSVRDRGTFVVTARGTMLDRLDPEDDISFTTMGLDGSVLAGPEPSSEWRLHQRAYLARADIGAVVHLHPAHAVLLDALGKRLRLLTLDHVAYVGQVARVPFWPNGSEELAEAAAAALAEADTVLLAFHGCSCVGPDVEIAYRAAVNLESAATATYRMLQLGDETTQFPPSWRAGAISG